MELGRDSDTGGQVIFLLLMWFHSQSRVECIFVV